MYCIYIHMYNHIYMHTVYLHRIYVSQHDQCHGLILQGITQRRLCTDIHHDPIGHCVRLHLRKCHLLEPGAVATANGSTEPVGNLKVIEGDTRDGDISVIEYQGYIYIYIW